MSEHNRKTPEHLAIKSKRQPLSTRVKAETKKILKSASKNAQTSVSDLAAAILDDYADWLSNQNTKQKT